jgi:hypothetical protein
MSPSSRSERTRFLQDESLHGWSTGPFAPHTLTVNSRPCDLPTTLTLLHYTWCTTSYAGHSTVKQSSMCEPRPVVAVCTETFVPVFFQYRKALPYASICTGVQGSDRGPPNPPLLQHLNQPRLMSCIHRYNPVHRWPDQQHITRNQTH